MVTLGLNKVRRDNMIHVVYHLNTIMTYDLRMINNYVWAAW